MSNLSFRPHHFLCALCFQGKGYSPEFVSNFSSIMSFLNSPEGENSIIEVVDVTDSICSPCPSRRDTLCDSQQKIVKLDNAHAKILHLKPGDRITWHEAKERIRQFMNLDQFHGACEPCSWKPLGICEKILIQHLQS